MSIHTALINRLDRLKREFPMQFQKIDINAVEIYMDITDNKERQSISQILTQIKKTKLPLIAKVILEGRYDEDLYGREPHNTTAMKCKHGRTNPRIYCVEFFNGKKKVVMARGLPNKSEDGMTKTIKQQCKAISLIKYRLFYDPIKAVRFRETQKDE